MLEKIRHPITDDIKAVDRLIVESLHSDIDLIQLIGERIINSGGKRLRPLLVLLSAKSFGYQGNEHIRLAAIIEFVHTATLLHDDVVDASELRRGLKTANVVWGNEAGVLVGDFLYSRAFQMIAPLNNTPVMEVLANATNLLAEGEVMQLINKHKTNITEAHYMEVIRRKTAMLFSAAAEIGAIIANATQMQQQAMAEFGLHLGNAFQIIDDLLDYQGNANQIGKNVGDDLAEGKLTLPLLYSIEQSTPSQRELIIQALSAPSEECFDTIMPIIQQTNAFEKTYARAIEEATKAKNRLPKTLNTPYYETLCELVDFSVQRKH